MKLKVTLLRRTCKQAAALLVAREDRSLSLPDALALRLHLLACKACPKFENQIVTLRMAMRHWPHDNEPRELPSVKTGQLPE
jgi:hypothetical protein